MYREKLTKIANGIEFTIAVVNDIAADVMTKAMPLIAPLPSAVAIYMSLTGHLMYHWLIALPTALAVEGLGFATADLMIKSWSHNRRIDDVADRAPFILAVIMFCTYMISALSLIVVLEVWPHLSHYAPGGFPFLTLIGALNLACNMLLKERKSDISRRQKRRQKRQAADKNQRHNDDMPRNDSNFADKMTTAKRGKIGKRHDTIRKMAAVFDGDKSDFIDLCVNQTGASPRTIRRDLEALPEIYTNGTVSVTK